MVVARQQEIKVLMKSKGLSKADVASAAGCDQRTIENLLAGKPVSGATIAGLLRVFAPLQFEDLFEIGAGAKANAKEAVA